MSWCNLTEQPGFLEQVDGLGIGEWSGRTYRHTSPGRDPLSGEGARQFGGRWNSAGRSTLYLAFPRETCLAELDRMLATQPVTRSDLAARAIHEIEVENLRVLDLRTEESLATVGLTLSDILAESWEACQRVGDAAAFLKCEGILTVSATASGNVLAVFPEHVVAGKLRLVGTEVLEFGETE